MRYCGLDFGTSNSTIGIMHESAIKMVPLEQDELTLPSALFFNFNTDEISFGRQAIQNYTRGDFGRLMRSMKSILGSSQMDEGTRIKQNFYSFDQIIAFFLDSLKQRAEEFSGQDLTAVTMGRPVHFNDNKPDLDQQAESHLEDIARSVGFKDVAFQFEPIAAAYDYEQQITKDQVALIIDMGGGTSDFTIIRLRKNNLNILDRQSDLLANHGIHIGGTDFDRHLSIQTIMHEFGMLAAYKDKPELNMPRHFYVDLTTWHRIHLLYERDAIRNLNELRIRCAEPEKLDALLRLLNQKDGHRLAQLVEQAKIELSNQKTTQIDLSFVLDNSVIALEQNQLNSAINNDVNKVFLAISETMTQAGISLDKVDTVFTTGGSTALPIVKHQIELMFPDADLVSGNLFTSVGRGLVTDAMKRFS